MILCKYFGNSCTITPWYFQLGLWSKNVLRSSPEFPDVFGIEDCSLVSRGEGSSSVAIQQVPRPSCAGKSDNSVGISRPRDRIYLRPKIPLLKNVKK